MMQPDPAAPAPTAHPILEWMPTYLATRAIQSHTRALHVAAIKEHPVEAT